MGLKTALQFKDVCNLYIRLNEGNLVIQFVEGTWIEFNHANAVA